MIGFEVKVEGLKEAARAFEEFQKTYERPTRPLLTRIGEQWNQQVFRRNFDRQSSGDGAPWAPRSSVGRQLRPGGRALQNRGVLLQSLRVLRADGEQLEVGTTLSYAHLLQFGGFTPRGSAIPGKRIPPRPFVELGPDAVARTYSEIEEYFLGPE